MAGLLKTLILNSIERSRRDDARAAALDNAMRLALDTAVVSDEQRALVDVPGAGRLGLAASAGPEQFGLDAGTLRANAAAQMARDQLGQSFNLADAGLDEHKLAQARGEQAKTLNFMQFAQALAEAKAAGRPLNVWEVMQGNVATGHALTPVDVQGDTVVNRYDTAAPVLGTTAVGQARIGAEQALGTYRTASAGDQTEQARLHAAQARQQEMLADERAKILANPNIPELLKLLALEGKTPDPYGKPEKVLAVDKNGKNIYAKAIPIAKGDGTFTVQPMRNPDGSIVEWTADDDKQTADIQNTEHSAANMGMTVPQFMEFKARQQLTEYLIKANGGQIGDQKRLLAQVDILMNALRRSATDAVQNRPGNPPRPAPAAPAQAAGGQPAAGRAAMPPEAATLIAQANAAIARGKDKNAVLTRLRAMLRELGVDPTAVGY